MMRIKILFACLLASFFFACQGGGNKKGNDSGEIGQDKRRLGCTLDLEEYSLAVDSTYTSNEDSVAVDLVWDALPGAQSYEITVLPSRDTFIVNSEKTKLTIIQDFELNEEVLVSLIARMDNNVICGPLVLRAGYCNGGGTVEDVPTVVNWTELCNDSECEFVRFLNRDIQDCNGNLLNPIPLRYRNGVYYKRADVCNCLTADNTIDLCDGVASNRLNPCLAELQQCLKHDYEPCGG